MLINTSPWSRLLRSLSIPGQFALGAALLAPVALCFFLVHGTPLKLLAPVLGLAAGVGISAWLFALARLFNRGGAVGRALGVTLAVSVVAGGALCWYCLRVVQPNARGACYSAAHPYDASDVTARLAEARAILDSPLYALAERLRPDPAIADECTYADSDDARRARGLCPRVLTGSESCRCGHQQFPRDRPCERPECLLLDGSFRLLCRP